jgi:transcriptional regulator with XRE-family HTH domain
MIGGLRLDRVGAALRLLRIRGGRRQCQVAVAAGITKAMLSAYETGKRLPSLKTLGPLLDALDADLADLHQALVAARQEDVVVARPARSDRDHAYPAQAPEEFEISEEEEALAEILRGFHRLLRHLHRDGRAARLASKNR